MIEEILAYNDRFVTEGKYRDYITDKYPNKKLAILSCMDTRLTELLPAALGIKNGDAKIIKNAGGVISHPYGSVVRSLLIAILELGVEEIMVIGHTDCGVQNIDGKSVAKQLKDRGIGEDTMKALSEGGLDFNKWMCGFDNVEESVQNTVNQLLCDPLIPKDVKIYGFVMNSETGELYPVYR